jgi:hypothetical protein
MVPQTDPKEAQEINDDFFAKFVEPFGILYSKWNLPYVLEQPYVVAFDATGIVTKGAHILMELFRNVSLISDSVEKSIRFHQNAEDADTFESNKYIHDPKNTGDERAIKLNPTSIRQWHKRLSSYNDVLADFLTESTSQSANLGSVADAEKIMKTCQDRVYVAAQLAGINLDK